MWISRYFSKWNMEGLILQSLISICTEFSLTKTINEWLFLIIWIWRRFQFENTRKKQSLRQNFDEIREERKLRIIMEDLTSLNFWKLTKTQEKKNPIFCAFVCSDFKIYLQSQKYRWWTKQNMRIKSKDWIRSLSSLEKAEKCHYAMRFEIYFSVSMSLNWYHDIPNKTGTITPCRQT